MQADPYEITDVEELQAMADEPGATYVLKDDLDATETAEWNGGAGFTPIDEFTGTLDGNGRSIEGLTITRPDHDSQVGLFSILEGTVRDLTLTDARIEGAHTVGALAGWADAATLTAVEASGVVRGTENVGGIAGYFHGSTGDGTDGKTIVTDCRSTCTVRGDVAVGGLAGRGNGSNLASVEISNCEATGPVSGKRGVGGLLGHADSAFDEAEAVIVTECATMGTITTGDDPGGSFGGLIGSINDGTVRRSHATGSVNCPEASSVGGLIGEIRDPAAEVTACYATGSVEGTWGTGGFGGYIVYGRVKQCFATGDVTGRKAVGGFGGEVRESVITDVYSHGDVVTRNSTCDPEEVEDIEECDGPIGGLIGELTQTFGRATRIERAIATGEPSGSSINGLGAVVGAQESGTTVSACYWDRETTGVERGVGSPAGADRALPEENGLPTSEIQGSSAASTLPEFDFEGVWDTMDGAYPKLRPIEERSGPAGIENLRLVQTVEHTRAIAPDGDRSGVARLAPVADELVLDESSPDIDWTASRPPLVAGRRLAPVFDLGLSDPEDVTEPVTLRGRLRQDGETFLEREATLSPAALQGENVDRRQELEAAYELDVPERLPLLEMLAENPNLVDGDYPTLLAAGDYDVEVEIDGPDFEQPITDSVSMDRRDVETTRPLTIGVVGLKKGAITAEGSYRFDGTPDIVGFAEGIAQYVRDTYPVTSVTVAALESPLVGPSANLPIAPNRAANIAERKLTNRLDSAQTITFHDGGGRTEGDDVSAVDVTVGVVPREEFFGGLFQDSDRRGVLPLVAGRPAADAVLVEIDYPIVAAHEMGHFFLGRYFEDPHVAAEGDESQHAADSVRSTGIVHRDGDLTVHPAMHSLMATTRDQWMDVHTYRGLVESDFQPFTRSGTIPVPALEYTAQTDAELEAVAKSLDAAPDSTLGVTSVEVDQLRSTVTDMRSELGDGLAAVDRYWEAPDALSRSRWQTLADLAASVVTLGEEFASAEPHYVADAETTTAALGRRLQARGHSLEERANERIDTDVSTVLEVTGTAGTEFDLDIEVLPVVGSIEPVDGDGHVTVRNGRGEIIEDASMATTQRVIGDDGQTERLAGAVAGAVRLPESAATVEVTTEIDSGAVSTEFDPTTGPITTTLQALPERAIGADARTEATETLDRVRELAGTGDRDETASELQSLYHHLDSAISSDYAPEAADEPTKDDILSRVGQQVQRFGGEVPDRSDGGEGLMAWLAVGSAAALVGGFALKWLWGDSNEEDDS